MQNTAAAEALSAMENAYAAAQKILDQEIWRCGDSDVVEGLHRIDALTNKIQGLRSGLVHQVDQRGVPTAVGAVNTAAWLRCALTVSPAEAKQTAKLAEALSEQRQDTAAALGAGHLNWEQAQAVVEILGRLSRTATLDQQHEVETLLLEHAGQLNAADLRGLEKVLAHYLNPDGTDPDARKARTRRGAHIVRNWDGTQTLKWTDTDENIALLQAALEPLAGPRPGPDGQRDPREPAVRRADALVDLVGMTLRHGDLPTSRGTRPHLVITLGRQPLARTATGEHLSDEAVRRICCDAELTTIRLDAHGVPLSMGRTRRIVSPAQWLALVARDTGCVFPGCDRPAAWAQAHHIQHWSQGGPTDLTNLALLCDRHHDTVHHEGWDIAIGEHGHPELRPPPWIDPERKPRQNWHWQPWQPRAG